jgi:hypothetical protein
MRKGGQLNNIYNKLKTWQDFLTSLKTLCVCVCVCVCVCKDVRIHEVMLLRRLGLLISGP